MARMSTDTEFDDSLAHHPTVDKWFRRDPELLIDFKVVRHDSSHRKDQRLCIVGHLDKDSTVPAAMTVNAERVFCYKAVRDPILSDTWHWRPTPISTIDLRVQGYDFNYEGIWNGSPGEWKAAAPRKTLCYLQWTEFLKHIVSRCLRKNAIKEARAWLDHEGQTSEAITLATNMVLVAVGDADAKGKWDSALTDNECYTQLCDWGKKRSEMQAIVRRGL